MQREITVEVVPSRGTGDAPVLYMLDGVGAPIRSTGWAHQAYIADRMKDENVHVVNPAGAYASYYTDWEEIDPVLGNNKWETFLTEELPAIVDERLNTNDKAAVGGISMGAQAAMHLAATHPDVYDAVMSFSGFYSTMDALGYQTVRLSVETRGGDVENMWGPHRSARWAENDTISHPEGLRGKAVYFSAGNAEIGPDDVKQYGANYQDLIIGLVLEMGVYENSKAFEKALDRAGIEHKVDFADTGLHNWPNFLKNFESGWDYIKPALYGGDVEPGTGTPGASGSAGSLGTSGSLGSSGSTGS
ncbi:alpha/beta hydrolase family protein [Dietzia sp. Alg238-R159]|uniref:alpha/beta hydrolase n=1 Tax=Dietzia sp. Alg238-R159 TaxID=2305986 RepID=UPI001F07CB5A|nr:alpha/beta hydrolase family protein [Dietzia sp. Alg238-R159]